jgi:S1-C subfamily serine protease
MALIPEHFFKAVVAIGKVTNNQVSWIGTGFLYGHTLTPGDLTTQISTYLVTNKHVLNGQDSVVLRFENATGTSSQFVVPLVLNGNRLWIGHNDDDVDVAVLLINGNVLHGVIGPINLFLDIPNTLPLNHAQATHLCEGDGIFLLGFPMGLVDQVQNLPVVRGGTLARIKDCRAGREKSFLIDCQTFPGNSGGPVLLRPEAVSIANTTAVGACYLIGVVSGYITYRDVAVSKQTGRDKIVFEENSGLSIVFPVDTIRQTIESALHAGRAVIAQPQVAPPELQDTGEVQAPDGGE